MITFVLTALCAMPILVPKSQIPHTPKKDAKTSENTDVSNVHFLLQIAYESHDHWKCDVAFAWEKPSEVSFFKKPMRFYNFDQFVFKKRNNSAIITKRIHHEMMVFTIHLLRAQERWKHCCQWMKIDIFFRYYNGQNEARNARGRGVGALLLLLPSFTTRKRLCMMTSTTSKRTGQNNFGYPIVGQLHVLDGPSSFGGGQVTAAGGNRKNHGSFSLGKWRGQAPKI